MKKNSFLKLTGMPIILIIRIYQIFISPITPATCRFYPTCSTYFIQALEKYEIIPPKDKRGNIPQQEKFILTHDGAVEKFEF